MGVKFILIWVAVGAWGPNSAVSVSGSATFDDPVACLRAAEGVKDQLPQVSRVSVTCYPASSQTDIVKEMEKLHQ